VAIAQALLEGARLLLLDEADAALLADRCDQGQELVYALRQRGITTVVATRNAAALTPFAPRVATLVNGQVSNARPSALRVAAVDADAREPARVAERKSQ
jgi:ABC-type branched-subunit amino acid transport system ATPase component